MNLKYKDKAVTGKQALLVLLVNLVFKLFVAFIAWKIAGYFIQSFSWREVVVLYVAYVAYKGAAIEFNFKEEV